MVTCVDRFLAYIYYTLREVSKEHTSTTGFARFAAWVAEHAMLLTVAVTITAPQRVGN